MMQPEASLTLSIPRTQNAAWTALLGGGIGIATTLGITLNKFLCGQLAIPPQYLEQRIQTILINGHAVDEPDAVIIADGDVIALSAAMPGLAGATLRRGGHLAPMRAAISQVRMQAGQSARQRGIVILKLFNLVAKEIGPQVLCGEIWIKGKDLTYLCRQNIIADDLASAVVPEDWVRLQPSKPLLKK